MSITISVAILILFLIKIVRDSLCFVWLWQVKMYRTDRMMSHLKEDNKIFQNNLLYILAVIIFILYFIFLKDNLLIFQYLVLMLFTFTFLQILKEIKKRSFKRPKLTFKTILIFLLLTIVYSMIAFCWISSFYIAEKIKFTNGNLIDGIELILFIYIVNPFVISSIILAINPFFDFQKKRLIKKATLKIDRFKKVKVIGITGSYGKTSTKEFLFAILSQRYKVVKTEGNNNTNIGVAYTVLNKVSDDYDYFICEMGAYKIGEIKEICGIAKPGIGILTGINEQHIELFGSIKNTTRAKFELIKTLPENGLAVINNKLKVESKKLKVHNIKYFSLDSIDSINNIKVFQDYVKFDYIRRYNHNCHCEKHQRRSNPEIMRKELNNGIATLPSVVRNDNSIVKFKLNLLGKHYIENILSAIITAEWLGMDLEEIKNAIEKIKPSEYMMRKSDGPNDSIFIDDSYSANPDGVIAALDYLDEAYKNYKKIIVFPGIIELGNKSEEVHKKLFDKIGKVCDTAYILSQNAKKLHSPKGTMEPTNNCEFVFEKDFDKVAKMVKNNLDEKTVVLFESRGAGVVMRKIL